jgi:hypothetical protein
MGLKHPPQTSCPRERKGFGILNPNCPRERERDLEYSTKLPKGEKGIWNTQPSCPKGKKTLKAQSKLLGNNFIIKKGNFPPK